MIPKIKKILYATDLSKNSSYAFLYAVDMARRHDAKIVILHSVEPVPGSFYVYSAGAGAMSLKEDEEQRQEAELNEIKKRVEEFPKRMEAYIGSSCLGLVSKVLVPQATRWKRYWRRQTKKAAMRSCSGHTEKVF